MDVVGNSDSQNSSDADAKTSDTNIVAACEAKLRDLVGKAINVICQSHLLDALYQQAGDPGVFTEDLTYGSPGEKSFAEHLASLSYAEKRVLHVLAKFGRGRRPGPNAQPVHDRLHLHDVNSSPVIVELVEGLPTLDQDLTKGYHRARRRQQLRQLSTVLDASGAASGVLSDEGAARQLALEDD